MEIWITIGFIVIFAILVYIIYLAQSYVPKPSSSGTLWGQKHGVAFATLMRKPIDLPLWLKYHRKMGIMRFYIRLEDSPSWEEYLKNMPDVVLEVGSSDKSGNNYSTLIDRQRTYVNQTLRLIRESAPEIDWLIHIDSDELLYGDISELGWLPDTDPDGSKVGERGSNTFVKTVKFENAEAVFEDDNQETCFSAKNFLRCGRNAPCKSYVNGKSAGRAQDPEVNLAGPHDFAYGGEISGEFQYTMPFDKLRILHYDSCTAGSWIEKFIHLSKNDKGENPFPYYKSSIESVKKAFDVYKEHKMPTLGQIPKDQVFNLQEDLVG